MSGASLDVQDLLRAGRQEPIWHAAERFGEPVLERDAVERLLPHREPFLFIDRILRVDSTRAIIACSVDVGSRTEILQGHFPARPVWPGVLQVEAIGQAGACLQLLLAGSVPRRALALTDILGAHFIRPVVPGAPLEIVTRSFDDGLFKVLVGQCLQQDQICSVAAVRGMETEDA